MYRVAIIVNENETLHSVYANAENIIKKALSKVYGVHVDELYTFEIFDKFNIFSLFEKGENNIWTFDSLFVATNACNNKEINEALISHIDILSSFIDDGAGNHHGIFVSNQQKLGGLIQDAQLIRFLPAKFSYKLIKRKEKKSYDGNVSIQRDTELLVSFPLQISNETIEKACSGKYNHFMPHKYRFYISPNYDSSYEIIYSDNTYDEESTNVRPLLIKSRIGNERVVISSMALDWAEHLEQLANIIIFITEGVNQFAFIDKNNSNDYSFERYIRKARDYKMALKEYDEYSIILELNKVLSYSNKKHTSNAYLPHKIFVFSSSWAKKDIETLWKKYIIPSNCDVSFYRLESDSSTKKDELILESCFSKSIRNSQMFLCAEEWLTANYIISKWRKSIWTYEYILDFYCYVDFDKTSFVEPLFREIKTHYKVKSTHKESGESVFGLKCDHYAFFEKKQFQTYDNVFNSTCACCNVLFKLYRICIANNIFDIESGSKKLSVSSLIDERNKFGNWIVYKIDSIEHKSRISWQDLIMAFVALYESGYISYSQGNDDNIYNLIIMHMKQAFSMLEEKIFSTNNGYQFVKESVSNADLCKALKFIYVFCALNPNDNHKMYEIVNIIENCLFNRQKYNGQWKNLSETAEVALALLYRNEFVSFQQRTVDFDTMINRAINYIQNSFDYKKSCWLDDENTTAKSLNVILHYDEIFNFAFDEFLIDLISNTEKYSQAINVNNNIKALDFAQEQSTKLQLKVEEKDSIIEKQKVSKQYSKKLINKYKFLVGLLSSAFGLSFLFILCLFGILASNYIDVLRSIVAENIAVIISTALGIVVTAILTGFAQHAKTKLIEEYEGKGEKRD